MKKKGFSEKLLIEEITEAAKQARKSSRGLPVHSLMRIIRHQLGISQSTLAKRAKLPQSTISRIEKGEKAANLSTLVKIFNALFCDLIVIPELRESIDTIRQNQARKKAEKRVRYLKGTMNLEEQQPDPRFFEELMKKEEQLFLHGSDFKLWEE